MTRLLLLLPHTSGRQTLSKGERCRSTLLSEARVLPDQFEPQLNLTRRRGRGTDDSVVAGADGIVGVVQEIGSREVGMIQDVEKF